MTMHTRQQRRQDARRRAKTAPQETAFDRWVESLEQPGQTAHDGKVYISMAGAPVDLTQSAHLHVLTRIARAVVEDDQGAPERSCPHCQRDWTADARFLPKEQTVLPVYIITLRGGCAPTTGIAAAFCARCADDPDAIIQSAAKTLGAEQIPMTQTPHPRHRN